MSQPHAGAPEAQAGAVSGKIIPPTKPTVHRLVLLGLIAPLITALVALFALGMEPKIGTKLVRFGHKVETAGQRQESNGHLLAENGWSIVMFRKNGNQPPQPTPLPEADWLKVLDEDRVVTVWLRDGPRFAGTVDDRHFSATVLRLKNVNLTELEPKPKPENPLLAPAADRTADVLVPWGDIRLISVDAPAPAAAETPRPAGTAAAAA